jgi:hypothetical protein
MTNLQSRWRTRSLVGDAKPVVIVRLRKGYMKRGYLDRSRIDSGAPIFPPLIWGGHNHHCFKSAWTPTTAWKELPNIQSVKWSRGFDIQTGGEKGGGTATIVMDNIGFEDVTGPVGLYHTIDRGHYSPSRGVQPKQRPKLWKDKANDWKNVLNAGWQIEVWEGYGAGDDVTLLDTMDPDTHSYAPPSGALRRTYTGIVTTCEQDSHPDHITITAADFSIFLTDQRIAGGNKPPEIPSPVTFADTRRTEGEYRQAGPYHTSRNTTRENGEWLSAAHDDPTDTGPWIEMILPQGYYEEFFVAVPANLTMFVSLHVSHGTTPFRTGEGGIMDRVHPIPPGWVNLTGPGTGTVNGYPYMRKMRVADSPSRRWFLGHSFNLPDGSRLRLTFTDLFKSKGKYYAGTDAFYVYRFGNDPAHPPKGTPATKNAKGYILIEDAAEVVRMILIWAGFQEWRVTNFGWSLFAPLVFGADKFYMDVITTMLQQGSFIFYMGQPTSDDRSIGVPHFGPIAALDPPARNMISVRDTDMTEALTLRWDLSDLPHVMRYRGAITKKPKGGVLIGFGIEGRTRRYQATYYPPWSGQWRRLSAASGGIVYTTTEHIERDGGVLRQFTESMGDSAITQLQSNAECLLACVLAALQYALNMVTVQFQVPGITPLNLNQQMAVIDEAAAVNSRVWVASIESEHITGGGSQPGHWRMTIGGSLVDTQEMDTLRGDYNYAWKKAQANKAALAAGTALRG